MRPAPRCTASRSPTAVAALTFALLASAGCGSAQRSEGSGGASSGAHGGSSGSASSSGGSSGSASSSGGSSGASSGASGSSSGPSDPACVGTSVNGQQQALDLYIMLDRSGSMDEATGDRTTSKWKAVTAALTSFVEQPLENTSVGLQYFGLPPQACPSARCSRDSDCAACAGACFLGSCLSFGNDQDSCSAAAYATPEVEIGPIAQTASRIRDSIAQQSPSTGTPTSAALQGAVDHARSWASTPAAAGHAVLVVLATDGEPTSCDTDLAHIDAIAAAGVSASPSIRTFVIGVGKSLSNLDGIAKAGGTDGAYLVDTGTNVTAQFLKALNEIRGKTVGCRYAIPAPPSGQHLDYGLVNVEYRPGSGGAAVTFGKVASAAACGTNAHAWYYDDPAAPTSIVLCPATCTALEADATAAVKIVLGCTTTGEW